MSSQKIVIDGKTYNSVNEMPEDVRRNYEDAMRNFGAATTSAANPVQTLNNVFADTNNNGLPDIVENQVQSLMGGMTFVVDGQTYNRLEDLPPEARAKYEQAMGSIDKNRNDMPDWLGAMMGVSQQPSQPLMTSTGYPAADTTRHAARTPMPASPAIAPDTSNGWMLALGALFILMVCALGAIAVWYFLLR